VLAPFCLFAVFIVYFVLLDSFLIFDAKGNVFALAVSTLLAAKIFQAVLVPEGFYVYFGFWLRQVPQLVLFYALITSATNMMFNWIGKPGGIADRNSMRQQVRQISRRR
jgi:hypothetical protein